MSDCCSKENNNNTEPDILVIGGGSAGFSAAITAAEEGANVVIAGEGTIGGTCVNVGCVPSKTMIRAMKAVHSGNNASRFDGVKAASEVFNWQALVQQKQHLVDDLRKAKYEDLLPEYSNISYVTGRASFTGNGTEIDVDGTLYHPKKIILATGSSSALPPINGIQSIQVLDSTAALDLTELPSSLLVIGVGVIGCELGQMFARAGVKVTICCRSRLLPNSEPEVSDALVDIFEQEGITVCQGIGYQKIQKSAKGIKLTCKRKEGQKTIEAEQVLVAAGRKPIIKNLRLEKAGIDLVFLHSIYLINLASKNPYILGNSIGSLVQYLKFGKAIGAEGAVFHVGSHKGRGFEKVAEQVVEAMNQILLRTKGCGKLIIENSAGAGGVIGSSFKEIGLIVKALNSPRIAVCLDTAHAFEFGYDIRTKKGLDDAMKEFDREIGLEKLVLIHANDSKTARGSNRDRHENIGKGKIGLEGFRGIVSHPDLRDLPFIIETPPGSDKDDIETLRSLSVH